MTCAFEHPASCFPTPVVGRVSVIVPCYNVEAYFGDFLFALLEQDWHDLEVILVNDGANSATTMALRDAEAPIRARGWTVILIEQENKGLGGALDAGLKHVSGEFLMWPDPDDWLLPGSIERRVQLMRENPDVGLLRSNCRLFVENKQEFEGYFMPTDMAPALVPELFEDLVFQRFFYAPVCHFVRCAMFWKVHVDRTIWFSNASSQNFQLLVPFVELFPALQVPDVLAVYRVREDSRSRAPTKSHEHLMGRHEQLYELTMHTLPKLQTYAPHREERVLNYHWRNKMLPTSIRAKMRDRGVVLLSKADLVPWRKAVARLCFALRCNAVFEMVDQRTGQIASRILSRTMDIAVRMPEATVKWGAGPLWAAPAAHQKAAE
ncbi:MAG: glycosyltransferase family A protein [Paracoccaceae bacterium]|nr:glycosyltransferase family A protein [Paracoccaceae bacterium]